MKAHWKVASGASEVKSKVAVVSSVGSSGPEVMVVSNGVIVHRWRAGVASKAPVIFTARTSNSCGPASKPSNEVVGSQEPHEPGSSSEHSKVTSGLSDEKAKSA